MADTRTQTKVEALSSWLKVLAEPNRLRIIDLLMHGEQCNCEMGDSLNMAPNLMSHHLSVLNKVGLVNMRRDPDDARWIHYSIDTTALTELSTLFGAFFDARRIEVVSRPGPRSSFIRLADIRPGGSGDGQDTHR
jgi:ArsR family transcriptional regulator